MWPVAAAPSFPRSFSERPAGFRLEPAGHPPVAGPFTSVMNPLFLFSFLLLATSVAAESLTPETATRLALAENPQLAVARALIAEAEARADGLGRLPNPELETEVAAGSRGRGRVEIGLSQTFPRSSRLRLERRVAAETLTLARLEVAAAELAAVIRVRTALVDLAAADAGLALVERQAVLARAFAAAQRAQIATGQLSELDAAQADLLAREAELALAESRASREATALALATELGREAGTTLDVAVDLSLPENPPVEEALGRRPDLALADAALAAGDADIALARTQGREDYRAGVFVEGEQDRDDFGTWEQEAKVGLRFSMPLPLRNTAAPAIAEKRAARRRLVLEHEALALSARNEIAATSANVRVRHSAARAIATELLHAALAHLAAAEAAHARGEAETAQLFRARERVGELERADLAARHAYHLAVIRHLAATGRLQP